MRANTLAQARFYLRMAAFDPKPEYIQAVIDYFMRNEPDCPIAEYLSIALTYARYGKREKAKEMVRDIVDFVCGGENNKYNGAKTNGEVMPDAGARVHEDEHR
ncbi:MAG: hypothetical protein J7K48_04595 [Thermococcus sp.]|nr:hypothetical protein [Thermococcus sp.]